MTSLDGHDALLPGGEPEPRFAEHMVALLKEHGLDKKQIVQESWG